MTTYQGVVYLQPSEARVRAGATVPLLAAHNGAEMAFTLEEDRLTRKGNDCELLAHPRFSPDGKWIAFTVQHQGSCEEVRVGARRDPCVGSDAPATHA